MRMFAAIAGFELRYQLRQIVFWVAATILALMSFGSVAVESLDFGVGSNVHRNSPYAIAQIHLVLSLFAMFLTTAFVSNVVIRDDETGFGPIIRATPLSKLQYLLGRFAGALCAAIVCLAVVPLAMWAASWMPWVDPQMLGPSHFDEFAFAYGVIGLPDLCVTAALFFAVATATRSAMWTYVSVIGLLVLYVIAEQLLDRPELRATVALLEPFGFGAFRAVTSYWTAAERNTLLPAGGVLFWNRALWLAIGATCLAAACAVFRFESRGLSAAAGSRAERAAARVGSRGSALWVRIRFEAAQVLRSPAFLVLIVLGLLNAVTRLWYAGDELYEAQIYPVTRMVIESLHESFTLVSLIIAVYYAGELVWGDRDRRMHEIVDATAASDWVLVLPKILAAGIAVLAVLLVSAGAGILVQTAKGYTHYELQKYVAWYILPQSIDWILLAVLAVFLQVLAPNKIAGWGLMVVYLAVTLAAGNLGFGHNLLLYGHSPAVQLSDMNGTGVAGRAAAWFRLYWGAAGVLLILGSCALWRRGQPAPLRRRLRQLGVLLGGRPALLAGAALAVFATTGAYIFLNTNVWNEYRDERDGDRYLAAYEKALAGFVQTPQPAIAEVRLALDLNPHALKLVTRGIYLIQNRKTYPLAEVHVFWARDLIMSHLLVEGATLVRSFPEFNYHVYRFEQPLRPGERRSLEFVSVRQQRGFRNSGNLTQIAANGTFIESSQFTPQIGLSRGDFLRDRSTRRRYGLPPVTHWPSPEDPAVREFNYAMFDWVKSDITVTTDADQTPIAPGYKVSDTIREGRRMARYVSDAPIASFFSIQSARYEVRTENHDGVELSVYYDRQHPWNVERMLRAMQSSLDEYRRSYGPYQFHQARILEFPAYETFAQAFPNTIPYSEKLGFITDFRNPDRIDYVTYVTAHEIAHQWWAHQILGAAAQGATVLSETLAQYSALKVMEKTYGPDRIRRFLKFELDAYLKGRSHESAEETPLMKVENQGYIHYRKGSLVMYLLKDRLGEATVDHALRSLLERYSSGGAPKGPPYPTTLDLIAALRAEAAPDQQKLITDLFERITIYDIRALRASTRPLGNGRYEASITAEVHKFYADGQGNEREVPVDESLDVGAFDRRPSEATFGSVDVLSLGRRRFYSGVQTFTMIVDRPPTVVGVDPYNKWIDRNSDDNLVEVRP